VQLTLDEMFDHPPVNEAELKQRLKGLQRAQVREELVDRMERGELEEANEPLVLALFRVLGPGKQQARLVRMASDKTTTPRTRFLALESLDEETKGMLGEHLHEVDPEAAQAMATAPLMDLMAAVQGNPAQAEMVTIMLLSTPEADREQMLTLLGHCRRKVGTPAAVAYRHALAEPGLIPFHTMMIEAVVEDGGEAGAALLELLRDETEGAQRRRLQKALLRLRTRAIEPGRTPRVPAGRALVTNADGQGTFILVVSFDNPDGSATVADLCIRAGGDLRDGLVLAHVPPAQAEEFIAELGNSNRLALAPLPLSEAAAMALSAVERTRAMGLPVPLDGVAALDLIGRVPPEPGVVREGVGPTPPLAQVRKLLKQPGYSAWFFDEGDMQETLQGRPPPHKPTAAWIGQIATRLEGPGVRARLVGMARHMARWHQLAGEPEQAALCARLARVTEENFANSPLVRVMLEQGLRWLAETEVNLEPMTIGDPGLRQRIKATFFADVRAPKGRDLARLDLTEAAYVALDEAVLELPGHRRPRDEQLLSMAFALGRAYYNVVASHKPDPQTSLSRALKRASGALLLDECNRLVAYVLPALVAFVANICRRCPVGCLARPTRGASDAFFSPDHPAPALLPDQGSPFRRAVVDDDHAE